MSNKYEQLRAKFLQNVADYEDEEFAEYDEIIRTHYQALLPKMEAALDDDYKKEIEAGILTLFNQMPDLSNASPAQTIVFDFNEGRSFVYLSAWGKHKKPVKEDYIPLDNKLNNCVFEEVGPFEFDGFEKIKEMLYEGPEIDTEVDLVGDYSAALEYLLTVKTLMVFKECFNVIFSSELVNKIKRIKPCYYYISLHDADDVLLYIEQ